MNRAQVVPANYNMENDFNNFIYLFFESKAGGLRKMSNGIQC